MVSNYFILSLSAILLASICDGQTNPAITSWLKSTGEGAGYGVGMINNVYKIQYSNNYVYTSSNSIPAYSIGPWYKNPGNAAAKAFRFQIPLNPAVAKIKQKRPPGPMGLWIDGVAMYGPGDSFSYNSMGIWNRNAIFWERLAFDSCNGHPDASNIYHTHQNPICLYDYKKSDSHSPIIGFAFDGFPVYGPYGYSSAMDSKSSLKLMTSSYRARDISVRTTLTNGTVLSPNQYGPSISDTYPLGSFMEDFEYVENSGDLDLYNGRYCVTPEYPNGIYAYFLTVNSDYTPQYPYMIGQYYYGAPNMNNIGPGAGKVNVTEPVTTYFSI